MLETGVSVPILLTNTHPTDGKLSDTHLNVPALLVIDLRMAKTDAYPLNTHVQQFMDGNVGNASKRLKYCCTRIVEGKLLDAHLNVPALLAINVWMAVSETYLVSTADQQFMDGSVGKASKHFEYC